MKRSFQVLLLCFLFFSFFSGCQSVPSNKQISLWFNDNGKIKVLSTIGMIDDIVKKIGKDDVDCIPLIFGELDPHSYELVKGDDEKFARADLIFYNGLGLEHGLSLRQLLENNSKALAVGDVVYHQNPGSILKLDGQKDPHIWMDVALWMRIIDPITEALSQKNPQRMSYYQENALSLKEQLQALDSYASTTLQSIPQEKRYLVTSHDAFRYFTKHYLALPEEVDHEEWEKRCAAPEGLAPDAQLSVTDIQEIINHVERYHIHVLFTESNVSKDSLRKILNAGKQKGLTLRLAEDALFGDAMGSESYIEMLHHNVNVISRELNREGYE